MIFKVSIEVDYSRYEMTSMKMQYRMSSLSVTLT